MTFYELIFLFFFEHLMKLFFRMLSLFRSCYFNRFWLRNFSNFITQGSIVFFNLRLKLFFYNFFFFMFRMTITYSLQGIFLFFFFINIMFQQLSFFCYNLSIILWGWISCLRPNFWFSKKIFQILLITSINRENVIIYCVFHMILEP